MSKTMKLVLNESRAEEPIFKEIKKKYITKSYENDNADREKLRNENEEVFKEIILTAKRDYGIKDEVIEEIFKMLYQNDLIIPIFLSDVINICNASHITDIESYKKAEKSIEFLITM